MNENIENVAWQREKALRTYSTGAIVFYASWLVRFILRETGLLTNFLDYAIAVPFVVGLVFLLYSFGCLLRVRRPLEKNRELREALNDERVQLNTLLAFKFGFFALLAGLAFFAIFNFFSPISDLVGVLISLLLLGAFGYVLKFYILERD